MLAQAYVGVGDAVAIRSGSVGGCVVVISAELPAVGGIGRATVALVEMTARDCGRRLLISIGLSVGRSAGSAG